jgi:AcrR family transcriptional regulator
LSPRSDATRNAERLISAARELFEESGPDVALDRVARRAGVGNATLYRHFPTRGDLLVAVYADEVRQLTSAGRALVESERPLDALLDWLGQLVRHVAGRRSLAMAATEDRQATRSVLFAEWHEAILTTIEALAERARAAGELRPDVRVRDLAALANGIALAAADDEHAGHLLAVVRRGLARA